MVSTDNLSIDPSVYIIDVEGHRNNDFSEYACYGLEEFWKDSWI
jgi:hypothetical protein